jgi:hypothetical protein
MFISHYYAVNIVVLILMQKDNYDFQQLNNLFYVLHKYWILSMKRILGPALLIVLVLGVSAAIFYSVRDQLSNRQVVQIIGLIGSEKEPFFDDPRVIEALREGGVEVDAQKAGSRQIATSFNLEEYDFAFPAGVPAAEKIRREQGISKFYDPFFTPMAIASWKPIAEILVANGVAERQDGYYTFDVEAYLELVSDEKRWNELMENTQYEVNKSLLVTSTDVRKSNSAAMYLALASYVANGNNIIEDQADIDSVLPLMEDLFLKQGYVEYSSAAPFENYLVMGMGKAPLVMIYEAQFLYQASSPEGSLTDDMVLMYPNPTIFSKHILIPLSEEGERLGDLLQTDPVLQELQIEHGFRNENTAYFQQFKATNNLAIPDVLVDIVEPPSYEVLERMIQLIEAKYE